MPENSNDENTVNQLCCTFKIKKLAKCYNTCMMTSILKLQHHSFVCPEASHKLIPVLITVYFELTTKPQNLITSRFCIVIEKQIHNNANVCTCYSYQSKVFDVSSTNE